MWNKKEGKYRQLLMLLKAIRKKKYDAVINLQRFAASGFLTTFSGAKNRIGFDKNPLSFLFTLSKKHHIGSKVHPGKHEVDRCLELVESFTDKSSQRPALYPSVHDFEVVQKFMSSPYVTISPASVWFTKQVPQVEWIALIKRLGNVNVWLLGAKNDRDLCQLISADFSNVKVLAGELSFLQSAALMKGAVMNYTSDSAPMHLCSAVNAPVTAVFCSTIPEFGFGPLSDRSFVIETKHTLDCRPCGLHGHRTCPQGHFKCSQLDLARAAANVNQSES